MTKRLVVLVPILIVSSALAVAMLTTDHDWGDDFAAYITQAVSILRGTEQESVAHAAFAARQSSRYYGPIAAPWGFPAVLAPAYAACGGLNIWCLKLINVPFFASFLVAFFLFIVRRLPLVDSTLVLSILAFSPVLLAFHDNVLSDLTFLFFSTWSILLIDRVIVAPARPEGSRTGNIGIGMVSFLAFFVRANGALLMPTLLLTQLALYRQESPSVSRRPTDVVIGLVPYGVFAALTVALVTIFPGGGVADLEHFKTLTLGRLLDNVSANIILVSVFFWPLPLYDLWYGALLPFVIGGAVLHWKRDGHAIIYAASTLLLFVLWPEQQGIRYLFPLIPFLVYFSYQGMRATAFGLTERYHRAGQRLTRGFWIIVLASFLFTTCRLALANLTGHRAPGGGPFDSVSREVFDFIKTRTSPADIIIFDKPRLMRLMTDRDAILIDRCDELSKGNVVVLRKDGGGREQVAPDTIVTCNPSLNLHPIFANVRFVVYRTGARPERDRSRTGAGPERDRSGTGVRPE